MSHLNDDLGLDTEFRNTELEFPTVTVCPLEPYNSDIINDTAFRTLARYEDFYTEYIPLLEMLPQISYDNLNVIWKIISESEVLRKWSSENKNNLRQLIFKVGIKCKELLNHCVFLGEIFECCDHFTQLLTERGFCYAFNARYISKEDDE